MLLWIHFNFVNWNPVTVCVSLNRATLLTLCFIGTAGLPGTVCICKQKSNPVWHKNSGTRHIFDQRGAEIRDNFCKVALSRGAGSWRWCASIGTLRYLIIAVRQALLIKRLRGLPALVKWSSQQSSQTCIRSDHFSDGGTGQANWTSQTDLVAVLCSKLIERT